MDSIKKAQEQSASEVVSRATKLCEQHMVSRHLSITPLATRPVRVAARYIANIELISPNFMLCVNHTKTHVSTYLIELSVTYISIAIRSKRKVSRVYTVQS
ncbi:hypothetical protein Hanom_Chr07g00660911 [Helianthus anomalus]